MLYLLDTNVCIVYLKGSNTNLKQRLESHNPTEIAVCSVVKAELFYGARKSQKSQQNLIKQQIFLNKFISLPFDDRCTEIYGEIRTNLENKGTPIGPDDLQIASIAIANDLILVTHNVVVRKQKMLCISECFAPTSRLTFRIWLYLMICYKSFRIAIAIIESPEVQKFDPPPPPFSRGEPFKVPLFKGDNGGSKRVPRHFNKRYNIFKQR